MASSIMISDCLQNVDTIIEQRMNFGHKNNLVLAPGEPYVFGKTLW